MLPKEIVKKVKLIEIRTNRIVNETLGGEYHSIFKGKGMEFNEVREYQYGDDIRSIDWNVTSRTGQLHVKKYIEERELTVIILVDVSGSVRFGTSSRFKNEIAVEIAALIAFSAIKNNDRVGLLLFTDKKEKYIPPVKGMKHGLRLIRELLYFDPEGKGTNIKNALDYLNRLQRKKAVIFLISDLNDSGYDKAMRITNQKHDLVVINLTDPREYKIPPVGLMRLMDNETSEEVLIDGSSSEIRETVRQLWDKRQLEIKNFLERSGIDYLDIDISASYIKKLVRFFMKRARKRR